VALGDDGNGLLKKKFTQKQLITFTPPETSLTLKHRASVFAMPWAYEVYVHVL
jgi:hypothetical protein